MNMTFKSPKDFVLRLKAQATLVRSSYIATPQQI